jgi:EpsD family peptidyl-prolyl cis-trans isomerase
MRLYFLSMAACAALLVGCAKEPTGQVAAVVNGDEITFPEINAELAGADIPANANKEEVQKAALQRIVDRRLLADAARAEDLDKSQEFLVRKRQLEDALLVQLLGEKLGRTTSVPTDREIDAYMQKHPATFAQRTVYKIDRIQFEAPSNPAILKGLADDHSMDAVAARLKGLNLKFDRQLAQMDSARLGEDRLKQILALPAGEPFLVREGGLVTVGVITGQQQVPIAGADARSLAVQTMRNETLSGALRQRLDTEKAKAKIEYKAGLAPGASDQRTTGAQTKQ